MPEVSVIGAGYVGLVTGACLAHLGHNVTCVEIDRSRLDRLQSGEVPFYEPGLDDLVKTGLAEGRLAFVEDPTECVPGSEFVFVAVQTPSASNGEANLSVLLNAIRKLAPLLSKDAVLIQKSTAPIGTADLVADVLGGQNGAHNGSGNGSHNGRRNGSHAAIVANPEFLREGTAIRDFLNPDRVIVGSSDREAARRVARLFDFAQCPVIVTDANTAEMIKYASNAFLATKISFINEIAGICDAYSVDVRAVAEGMGYDPRIAPEFLRAGLGWGGSCFPKDVDALIHMGEAADVSLHLVSAARRVNAGLPGQAVAKLQSSLGTLSGAVVALLGLSFKPGTDDLRCAPSLDLGRELIERGARVRGYDPAAMERAAQLLPGLETCEGPYEAADGADALVLVTEWEEFGSLDMDVIAERMRRRVVLDGRNFWDGRALKAKGFKYAGFGVPDGVNGARHLTNGNDVFTEGSLALGGQP